MAIKAKSRATNKVAVKKVAGKATQKTKKVVTKKSQPKAATAKKLPVKTVTLKKSLAKKVATKKVVNKKSVAKKVTAKKSTAKKVMKKIPIKKAVTKKAIVKTQKSSAKATIVKKVVAKSNAVSTSAKNKVENKSSKNTGTITSIGKENATEVESATKTIPAQPEVMPLIPIAPPRVSGNRSASVTIKAPSRPEPVAPEKVEPWTKAELNSITAQLNDELITLEEELRAAEQVIADLIRDSGEGAGDDQADAGSKTFEREQEMSLANNARDMILQVNHALARIQAGTYGVCESCGNAIPKHRLEAFPRATLCMVCKRTEERLQGAI